LSKLYQESRNADIVIYKIAIKEKEKDLIKFRDKFKISCPILIDERGRVANAFHVWGHPETYFINRKGKIAGKALGGKDWTSLNMRNLIQYLLREDY
jgi:cytochrome c biogenesis protein CcmG/thiol:disulfide interchange protein DsbE